MTDWALVALLTEAALAAVLAGLLVRGRWRGNVFFTLYVGAALTGNILVTWWPDAFYVWWFWRAKQATYDLLKLGLALEVAARSLRAFPGARRVAGPVILAIVTTTAGLMLSDIGPTNLDALSNHARLVYGTVWVMLATFAIAVWCRVPLDPFRRTVLVSLGSYMGVLAAAMRFEGIHGWSVQPYVNAVEPSLYLVVAAWWALCALAGEDDSSRRYRLLMGRILPRTA